MNFSRSLPLAKAMDGDTLIALRMNGDWLEPKSSPSETEVFLEKPPLKFWIVAAPISSIWG